MSAEGYTEKVSVNVNSATLSSIDLLVDGGYYSNRSDFINQALRAELQRQQSTVDRLIRREESGPEGDQWFIGISGLTKREIAELYAAGEKISVRGYGVFHLPADVDAAQLFAVVESIRVRGRVIAPDTVKQHYGIR